MMMTTVEVALALGLLGAEPALPAASGSTAAAPCARITIRTWDIVPVAKDVLERARAVAEQVFARTGTEITWIDCALEGAPSCSTPRGPDEISLRIYRRSARTKRETGASIGGLALVAHGGGVVHVHYDRLEEISREGNVPIEVALGITAAHEFGHLLMGAGHSTDGIMRATLKIKDWDDAASGELGFNRDQTSVLRTGACRERPAEGDPVPRTRVTAP